LRLRNTQHLKEIKDWKLIQADEGEYFQSEALAMHGFAHGFFTKNCNSRRPRELADALTRGLSVHMLSQVHGSNVIEASSALEPPWPSADGLISNKKKQSLWIYSADCIPVLFADPNNGFVGACHAGWRGITKGILLETIKRLELKGSKRSELLITLGPAISSSKYQVKLDLVESIYKSIYQEHKHQSISTALKIRQLLHLGILNPEAVNNKFFLDIRLAASNQLTISGIRNEKIFTSPFCTFMNKNFFYSWRREHVKAIQWSGIVCKV